MPLRTRFGGFLFCPGALVNAQGGAQECLPKRKPGKPCDPSRFTEFVVPATDSLPSKRNYFLRRPGPQEYIGCTRFKFGHKGKNMPRLIILPKGQGIRQVNIKGSLTTIGRKEGNSLVLDSDRISRTHAVIDWDGDNYTVIDTGSRNGTYVNGRRVRRQMLRNGDMISIGDCEIRFLFDTRAMSEEAALRLVTIPGALADLDAMAAAARKRAQAPAI